MLAVQMKMGTLPEMMEMNIVWTVINYHRSGNNKQTAFVTYVFLNVLKFSCSPRPALQMHDGDGLVCLPSLREQENLGPLSQVIKRFG
ncbi:Uncharacterized protein HZ326_26812 [Fusarium oxysporum f. sp. albedinis]|nr:Uncharacterized protein HZ326_26812 [Fusarium oxysporum f. sp. albedinis]